MTNDGMLALHTVRAGDPASLPLVLLHAFPLDHRMWLDLVDLLVGDPTVLAPDLPGFGISPSGPDVAMHHPGVAQPSVEVMADAVARALAFAGVTRAVVAGLSMGGYVALALAERRPDLVAGLGLLDTKAAADTDDARATRHRVADQVLAEQTVEAVLGMRTSLLGATTRERRRDLEATVERWIADQGAAGVAWAQRAMASRPDRLETLRAYRGESLVLRGAEDEIAPAEQAATMADALGGAAVVTVPSAGHLAAVENPQPVAAALSELWRRADVAHRSTAGEGG